MKRFNEGDVVYFISSSVFIKKATVIRNAGGFCTIRFSDGNCGTSGTRVRESKLYRTEEEAKKVVEQTTSKCKQVEMMVSPLLFWIGKHDTTHS